MSCSFCQRSRNVISFICTAGHSCCDGCFNILKNNAAIKAQKIGPCSSCLESYDNVGIQVIGSSTGPVTQPANVRSDNRTGRNWLMILLIILLIAQFGLFIYTAMTMNQRTAQISDKIRATLDQWGPDHV